MGWSRERRDSIRHTQRSEKPPVLSTCVAALKNLLDILLSIFALGNLLECVCRDAALEALEFESVASGHEVAVVDGFDEWPELASLRLSGLVQAASHLARVSRNADDEGMAVWMRLVTRVDGLDNDNLRGDGRNKDRLALPGLRAYLQTVATGTSPLRLCHAILHDQSTTTFPSLPRLMFPAVPKFKSSYAFSVIPPSAGEVRHHKARARY